MVCESFLFLWLLLENIPEWCKLRNIYHYLRKKVKEILWSFHHAGQGSTLVCLMIYTSDLKIFSKKQVNKP